MIQPKAMVYGAWRALLLIALACAMVMPSRSQSQPSASRKSGTIPALKAWGPPKTSWGDPDLQGMWPGTDLLGVPLQRDPKLGTRAFLTDDQTHMGEAAGGAWNPV